MTRAEKSMKDIQNHLRRWADKAGEDYPHQLEEAVRHAANRLDSASIARASEQVLTTLTGNHKLARKARKSVEESLESARQKLSGQTPHRGRRVLLGGAIGLLVGIVGILVWKVSCRDRCTAETGNPTDPVQETSGTRTDPDMSNE